MVRGKIKAFMETDLDNLDSIIKSRSAISKAQDSAVQQRSWHPYSRNNIRRKGQRYVNRSGSWL
jgi:hypothetical protein